MGWKNIKEHYRIGHIVQMDSERLLIGSGYISDIIVVAPDGTIVKRYDRQSGDLARYQTEIESDPKTFAELLSAPDVFEKSIPVYTYSGADILEKQCEEPGWPNVTHDGELMYENTHSTNRDEIVWRAKRNASSAVSWRRRSLQELEEKLLQAREELAACERELARLDAEHPHISVDDDYEPEDEGDE